MVGWRVDKFSGSGIVLHEEDVSKKEKKRDTNHVIGVMIVCSQDMDFLQDL